MFMVSPSLFLLSLKNFLFIYLLIVFLAAFLGMRNLVSQPGIEPEPPALEGCNLNHWTAKKVPILPFTTSASLSEKSTHSFVTHLESQLSIRHELVP